MANDPIIKPRGVSVFFMGGKISGIWNYINSLNAKIFD
jgi:hypothetical protein